MTTMRFAGVEWAPSHATGNGWTVYKHPTKPVVMLTREDQRRFIVRGQLYSTWAAARRMA